MPRRLVMRIERIIPAQELGKYVDYAEVSICYEGPVGWVHYAEFQAGAYAILGMAGIPEHHTLEAGQVFDMTLAPRS